MHPRVTETKTSNVLAATDDCIAFQVLGPTDARQHGWPIPLSGARRRALLARLLVDVDHPVPVDTLIQDVWDGDAPPVAVATLHSHVSQLRKALGARLQRTGASYRLCLDGATLDAIDFEDEVGEAAVQLARQNHRAGAATLRHALGLWLGRALQDVADRRWAQPEAARLEELRNHAVEQLLHARLDAGDHERLVADAEVAVEEGPWREQRWATLMLALYRSGRQADALRTYQRLRSQLAENLGIDPSPPLIALEAAILRQDPALDPDVDPNVEGRTPTEPEADETRRRAYLAAEARDWVMVCQLLVAADGEAPLDASALELLGDAAFMSGEQDVSITARQRAHHLWLHAGNRARAAVDALWIAGNHYVRNRPALAAGWFHRGRHLLEGEALSPAHGVLAFTGALIALAHGDLAAAAAAAAEAEQIASQFGEPDIEAVGQTLHAWALVRLGRMDEAEPMLDEALARATSGELGPVPTGQIFCWSTQALLAAGNLARAAEWLEAIESCGVGGIPGDCRVHRAQLLRALGELDQARDEALLARREIEAVDLLHVGMALYELAMVHLVQGQLDEVKRYLQQAAACGAVDQPGLALLFLARGEVAAAAESIREALDEASHDPLRRIPLLSAAVQIASAMGDEDLVERWSHELLDLSSLLG